MRFDFARQIGQQLFESRLRVYARIHDHLAPQHHARGLFQESEREPGMKGEVILAVFTAPRKADLHGLLQRGAARNHGEIHGRLQHRRRFLLHSHHVDGKRRHPEFHIAHVQLRRNRAPRRDVLGHQEIQLQPGQAQAAHQPEIISVESMVARIRNSRLLAEATAAKPTSTTAAVNSTPPRVTL